MDAELRIEMNHLIDATLTEFRSKLETLLMNRLESLEEKVNSLEMDMHNMDDKFKNKMKALESKNESLNDQVESLTYRTKKNDIKMNEIEQYSRRNNLRFRGIKVEPKETVTDAVIRVVNTMLKLQNDSHGHTVSLSHSDIEVAHYIKIRKPPGASVNESNRSKQVQSIIVRFFDRNMRDRIIRARKQLKKSPITICEDLTAANQRLLETLNSVESVSKSWSWNGKLFYLLQGIRKTHQIQLHDELPQ